MGGQKLLLRQIVMGHGESKFLSEEKQLLRDYSIDSRVKEENLTYLTHRDSGRQFLLREIIYTAEPEYQEMLRRLEQRKAISSPFLTRLERLEHFKEENLCSNYYRIYALWEYPRKTLADEITYRALLKQPFDERELRTLLLQLAEGLATYEQHKKSHECLTTRSILVAADSSVRVVDVLALPLHPNLEIVYQKRSTKNAYLSPEHCRVIASQHFDNSVGQPFKEDVFIAGMIALECALLERQDDCYQQNWESVNWDRVEEKLNLVENRYGREMRTLIKEMLEPSSDKRIDWRSIVHRLDPKSSLNNQPELRVSNVGQSFIREGFQSRAPIVQRVAVSTPAPVVESIRKVDPRSSFCFTYHSRQVSNEPVQSPVQIPPRVERISFEQGPVVRVMEPVQIIQHAIPQMLPPLQNQHQVRVIRQANYARPPPIQTSMSSKFTPIALSDTKPKVETVPTAINNQNGFIATVNNEFKINSPTIQEVNPALPPEVKNFSLHIADPIYSIDEYAEGKRYEGYKVNGKKEGEGRFYLQNKLCFEGHWKDDLMEGEGKLYYQSGVLAYDGMFEKDRFHGFGKLYNEAPEKLEQGYNYENFEDIEEYWISYEGYFENDLKEGKGELYLTNGEHFEGNFHIDFVEGEGVYTTKDGRQIHGIWHENKLERILN